MCGDRPPPTLLADGAGGDAGFTIVEVLVAFAITAIGTLLVLETGGMIVSGIRRLDTMRVAVDEAEGVVLQRLANGALAPGLTQGTFSNGAVWTLSVTDARPAVGLTRSPPLWRLRVTRDRPVGEPVYATVVAGDPDG